MGMLVMVITTEELSRGSLGAAGQSDYPTGDRGASPARWWYRSPKTAVVAAYCLRRVHGCGVRN